MAEGEKPHPANYRGCRHAEEEMQKKKSQKISKTTPGRMFSSSLTTPSMSFAEALRGRTEEQKQPQTHRVSVAGPATMESKVPADLPQYEQERAGQSVRALNENSLHLDKMLNVVVAVVQQIMKEFNGAVLEEAKIVDITKIVLNLMEQNGHKI
jgi:hypothetical protein